MFCCFRFLTFVAAVAAAAVTAAIAFAVDAVAVAFVVDAVAAAAAAIDAIVDVCFAVFVF